MLCRVISLLKSFVKGASKVVTLIYQLKFQNSTKGAWFRSAFANILLGGARLFYLENYTEHHPMKHLLKHKVQLFMIRKTRKTNIGYYFNGNIGLALMNTMPIFWQEPKKGTRGAPFQQLLVFLCF